MSLPPKPAALLVPGRPLTLAGVADGAEGLVAADLARAVAARSDAPATSAQKNLLKALTGEKLGMKELAGEPVRAALTTAPGNGQAFGGIKVVADSGWFADTANRTVWVKLTARAAASAIVLTAP